MVQNLWRVQFQGGDCPPPEELRGGTKNFSGASRPICPPPELNPVSATVYIYIYIYICRYASKFFLPICIHIIYFYYYI